MSIPFDIEDEAFAEGSGLLRLESEPDGSEVLVMELQMAWLGLIKQAVQVVAWPLESLAEARFKRGVFKDTLYLRPTHLDLIDQVPGTHKSRLKLKVKKEYRDAVYDLLDALESWRPVRTGA